MNACSAPRAPGPRRRQRGAALLAAMLIVTLVAAFASAALWQQWRAVEVESAERGRVQSAWVLIGALDWARLILREDGRAGNVDALTEPWAVPLEEARLSSFLSAEKNVASDSLDGLPDTFLSGQIIDAQSRLNVMNLVVGGQPVPAALAAFTKLFGLLNLPAEEVSLLTSGMQRASAGLRPTPPAAPPGAPTPPQATGASEGDADGSAGAGAPLMPQHLSQLVWFGLSAQTVAALEPFVTVLPTATRLNINTASAEAIAASVPALDLARAQQLVAQRMRSPFRSLADVTNVVRDSATAFTQTQHDVRTSYFEVTGRLRLDRTWVEEHSLLRREGTTLTLVWRERASGLSPMQLNQ